MLKPNRHALSLFLLVLAFGAACGGESGTPPAEDALAAEGYDDAPQEDAAGQAEDTYPLGAPRDDLDRFYGVYGDPERPGRDFFVAPARRNPNVLQQIPEGYLMIGAMWGDVAPWYMKALSDTRFEQQWVNPHRDPLVAEFELGNDGAAVALMLNSIFADRGRLQRLRDLPEKWQ